MIIFGASGHGKVIATSIESQERVLEGFFDDAVSNGNFFGVNVFGPYDSKILKNSELVIGIGDNRIREKIALKIKHSFGTVIDKSSNIDKSVYIGEGTVILKSSTIQADAKIGKHVIVNTGASIDHDCHISDYVHVSPNATLCGNVKVGKGTHIGANATIIPNIEIGSNVVIGAGSVVIRNIESNTVVVGNPAKKTKNHGK